MKLLLPCLVVSLFSSSITTAIDLNLQADDGCVETYLDNVDYFPQKVMIQESQEWTIEYENSYKIIHTHGGKDNGGDTYILYQCGTPQPLMEPSVMNVSRYVSVPVSGIALSDTTLIPHMEQLNQIGKSFKGWVATWSGSVPSIHNACIHREIELGTMAVLGPNEFEDDGFTVKVDNLNDPELQAAFKQAIGGDDSVYFGSGYGQNDVPIRTYDEQTSKALFEWNKFFAAFLNMEAESNALVDASFERFQCYSDEAAEVAALTDNGVRPKIAWALSPRDGVFDIAQPDQYYGRYAELCSADLLVRDGTDGTVDIGSWTTRKYYETDAFFDYLKDADAFVYAGYNWEEVYSLHKDRFDQMPSVINNRVYDILGVQDIWFETRLGEPEVLLQDMCAVAGHTSQLTQPKRNYFRQVQSEGVELFAVTATCDASGLEEPFESRATMCEFQFVEQLNRGDDEETSSAVRMTGPAALMVLVSMTLAALSL